MYPVLFSLGWINIYAYGVDGGAGLGRRALVGWLFSPPTWIATFEQITDFALYVIISGLILPNW